MSNATAHASEKYYVPHSSHWPIIASASFFTLLFGAVALLNDWLPSLSGWVLLPGFGLVVFMFIGWFNTVIGENQQGVFGLDVDRSFRMGMMWFIFSEVMFFAAFFGALFYARSLSVPWLGGEGTKVMGNELLHPLFENAWPTNGPAKLGPKEDFAIIPAFGLPAINTIILLMSGVTVTIAHHALRAGNRAVLNIFLFLTFALGFSFVYLQATEYHHAYTELGLTLGTGIYGSTFFMLTGFHGFHVTLGAIMLVCIWLRTLNGHFTPERHFAFEAVAWYWHFVDVVWLGLFIFVYWI